MKKAIVLAAALAFGGASMAQSVLSKQDVKELVTSMVEAYKAGKANGMKEVEADCWKDRKRGEDGLEGGVLVCSLVSVTGHAIESLESDKRKRKIAAYWVDDAMAQRIANNVKRVGMSEKTFDQKIQREIDKHTDFIAETLVKAGIGV